MRILYVEDNPANISLLQRVARMGGHEVLYYNEGEKALENFASDNPDLILMDVQLAGQMSGLDVVRKLRSDGVRKPIVAVTAYAMTGDKERCLEAGCDAYLSKPLPVAELVEMVNQYQAMVTASSAETAAIRVAPPKPEPEKATAEATATEKPADTPTAEAKAEPAEEATPAAAAPEKPTEPVAESAVAETPAPKVEATPAENPAAVATTETGTPAKPDAAPSVSVDPVTPKPTATLEPAVFTAPVASQNGHTTPTAR